METFKFASESETESKQQRRDNDDVSLINTESQRKIMDHMLLSLKAMNKDVDDVLTPQDVSEFLNANSSNGVFPSHLLHKLNQIIFHNSNNNTSQSNIVTVPDFMNNFISIISETRKVLTTAESKLHNEQLKQTETMRKLNKYKHERVLKESNGFKLSDNATFELYFRNIEFKTQALNDKQLFCHLVMKPNNHRNADPSMSYHRNSLSSNDGNNSKYVTSVFDVHNTQINQHFQLYVR